MKIRSVRYLIGEGIKNLWANRLMTIASVGVLVACMVIIGLAMLLTMNINDVMENLEEENVILAYFDDENNAKYGIGAQTSANNPTSSDEASSNESSTEDSSSDDSNSADNDSDSQSDSSSPSTDKDTREELSYTVKNEEEGRALVEEIKKIPNVKDATYISSNDGLEKLKENVLKDNESLFSFFGKYGNPLQSGARIELDDMSKFDETLKAIEETKGVSNVRSFSEIAKKITALKNGVAIAGFWIIAILLIISLVIVSNTIRVTMYTRKLEIGIMKAVGATNSFIRLPFVIEGVSIGIISAILSVVLIGCCYRLVEEAIINSLGTVSVVPFVSSLLPISLVAIGIGIVSGLIGSVIMISKYLRKEGSEFTAI